ncbi:NACHT domain-containing protein [Actinomadura macra]|uniref:NACHT domain-containing protein n=1 Tax=Actinomadura macra TaxID=46164 RepID=UPI00082EBACF|nr:AAA family ATPase [Actinomadura macra]
MARGLSYADAVKLLGGTDSAIVTALDRLTGGILLAASSGGSALALSLFDAKGELFRHGHALVGRLVEKKNGLGRADRTERLAAAQRVLAVTAFFEVVSEVGLPFDTAELRLGKADQMALAGGDPSVFPLLVDGLTNAEIPLVTPATPYQQVLSDLLVFHASLSEDLLRFIMGLVVWDRLDAADRTRLFDLLRYEVPSAATRRFEEHFRRLATDFPEVAFWTDRADHQAARQEIHHLRTSLAGLRQILDQIAAGRVPDDRRAALARRYQARLGRPVSESGDIPGGLAIPTLEDAYVNPHCRIRLAGPSDALSREDWWQAAPVRDDLQELLIGHLTAPEAAWEPLLLLGQPGSGKSVLTQVLAARLPAADFMVVRVVLRETPADADLQGQIEHAVRDATGEAMVWTELARSSGDAFPVVILDGFDELLQATGVSQSDYLQQVVRFQERESDQGRPVAVIVTSRTAVADRARIPIGGVTAIRLEPFSDEQIGHWLDIWNTTNSQHFTDRGIHPLSVAAALSHGDLARQPLLLLMLALYDADANALGNDGESLDLAGLYERLLTRFAEREIGKTQPGLDPHAFTESVEAELLRLSIAAFAMFNRGRQWTTEQELTGDLAALFPERPGQVGIGFRTPLTPGQTVIGRFFFIHQSQALTHETRLSTYEFLHATFGEFLVARLTAQELTALARVAAARSRHQMVDDTFLRALISYAPLTDREPIVDFLQQFLSALPAGERAVMGDFLLSSFHTALEPRRDQSAYAPVQQTVPAHHAVYLANILVLTTIVRGSVTGGELFPGEPYPVGPWWRCARLMQSQLQRSGWSGMINTIRLERITTEGNSRDIRLTVPRSPWDPKPISLPWTFHLPSDQTAWSVADMAEIKLSTTFSCDEIEDIMSHALEPLRSSDIPEADNFTTELTRTGPDRVISFTHALVRLWSVSGKGDATSVELAAAYEECLDFEYLLDAVEAILRPLAADAFRLPREWRADVLDELRESIKARPAAHPWARQAFHDLDLGFLDSGDT